MLVKLEGSENIVNYLGNCGEVRITDYDEAFIIIPKEVFNFLNNHFCIHKGLGYLDESEQLRYVNNTFRPFLPLIYYYYIMKK